MSQGRAQARAIERAPSGTRTLTLCTVRPHSLKWAPHPSRPDPPPAFVWCPASACGQCGFRAGRACQTHWPRGGGYPARDATCIRRNAVVSTHRCSPRELLGLDELLRARSKSSPIELVSMERDGARPLASEQHGRSSTQNFGANSSGLQRRQCAFAFGRQRGLSANLQRALSTPLGTVTAKNRGA